MKTSVTETADQIKPHRIGIYAGSFDPFTNGHLDIAARASKIVDTLIIAIGYNPAKSGFFTMEERKSIISSVVGDFDNIVIDEFQGLLVNYCRQKGASIIVRGLRNAQDFEFEATLGRANRHLNPSIETMLLLSDTDSIFVSSSLMKEIVLNGGSVEGLVPEEASKLFLQKLNRK